MRIVFYFQFVWCSPELVGREHDPAGREEGKERSSGGVKVVCCCCEKRSGRLLCARAGQKGKAGQDCPTKCT